MPVALSLALLQMQAEAADTNEPSQLDNLNNQIAEQTRRLEQLRQSLDAEQARLRVMRRAVSEAVMQSQRGTGDSNSAAGGVATAAGSRPTTDVEKGPVGRAPDSSASSGPAVAPIFEETGVLTPKSHFVLEPSIQYGYSSNDRVALLGYTIIPALVIGLIDVREVKRNTTTAALTGRYGITNRLEVEARVPYVYRSDATVSRSVGSGSAVDDVFQTSGQSLGDVELAARYQFNDGGIDRPYFIGSLRFKSRTGRDPFQVVTDCVTVCTGTTGGTGLPLSLPTGSGFYSTQAALTWLMPSDPAVFFGTFSYLHNQARNVSQTVLNGQQTDLGRISPGDVFGFNFGMGLSINDKSSFSVGYDQNSVGRTRQNGEVVAGSVRLQLASLLLGYSLKINPTTNVNLSIGAGLTRDTPDVTLTLRVPVSF